MEELFSTAEKENWEQPQVKVFDEDFNCYKAPQRLPSHKHVSVVYGMEFSSKVQLFVREHSQSTTSTKLENISKEELFKKVLSFLHLAVYDQPLFQTFIRPFKTLDQQMELSIKRSNRSLSSSHSADYSVDSGECGSIKITVFKQMCNSLPVPNEPGKPSSALKLRKAKTSMMSKCNRISIADTINVAALQALAHVQAIESKKSLQSLESQGSVEYVLPQGIKGRRRLSSEVSNQQNYLKVPEHLVGKPKKISIMIIQDFSGSSEIFSEGDTCVSLSDIQLPNFQITETILDMFFDTPSPFLVNLALCLLCKCVSRGKVTLQVNNVGWLLGVATVVAYKLYFDEPVDGLMEWFCEGMKMELDQLILLERWFLGSLNYQVVVSNQQYQNMMLRLMTH